MPIIASFRRFVCIAVPVAVTSLAAACGGDVGQSTSSLSETEAGTTDPTGSSTPCRSSNDCSTSPSEFAPPICVGPITAASLCVAFPACTSDTDCTNDFVCSTGVGLQADGSERAPTCRPACTSNADCNGWESCQSDGKCQPLSCDQCPSYLTCTSGACGPKGCTEDSDCTGGYCVDSTCFATLGTCSPGCG
jgi:hypothetical protein